MKRLGDGKPELEQIGFAGLDKLLEHRVRLAICVLLSRYKQLTFTRLKALLVETDGSLGAHLAKLETSGYLRVEREFTGRRPTSWYSLTKPGRVALREHVAGMSRILDQMKS
jgi:DNA-binding PadR family transcriptional regulator